MSVPLSHTYAQDGEYTVTVTVNDGELEGSSSAPLVVNNVAPTVDAGSEATILEGSVFDRTGSFTDPGEDVWTATVDYGDGSGVQDPLALTGKTGKDFTLSHVYADDGVYEIIVTVSDGVADPVSADGGEDSGTAQVTFIHQILIDKASVKLDRRDRQAKDRFDVDGRLPRSLLGCLDWSDMVSVELEGLGLVIPAEALEASHWKG